MKIFDPFSDRTARNIRNALTKALVEELNGESKTAIVQAIQYWKSQDLKPVYQNYIEDRQNHFQEILNRVNVEQIHNPRFQTILLWNAGLFFELHELLEAIWMPAKEPERTGLKGLIQAAGVYVHLHRGKVSASQRLAKRSRKHLAASSQTLAFIDNLAELINALKHPALPAPLLIAKHN